MHLTRPDGLLPCRRRAPVQVPSPGRKGHKHWALRLAERRPPVRVAGAPANVAGRQAAAWATAIAVTRDETVVAPHTTANTRDRPHGVRLPGALPSHLHGTRRGPCGTP